MLHLALDITLLEQIPGIGISSTRQQYMVLIGFTTRFTALWESVALDQFILICTTTLRYLEVGAFHVLERFQEGPVTRRAFFRIPS